MRKNTSINGLNDNRRLLMPFYRSQFGEIYYNSDEDTASVSDIETMLKNDKSCNFCDDVINGLTTELIENCVNDLKVGKACDPNELSAEHVKHAHPLVVHCMRQLFILMARHEHVPSGFSKGINVLLVKDKSGDICSSTNYRPITLVPVIFKVFEMFILNICADNLVSDDLQFGLKNGLGCANAIFTLRTTIDYFTDRGSSMYAASLDISIALLKR